MKYHCADLAYFLTVGELAFGKSFGLCAAGKDTEGFFPSKRRARPIIASRWWLTTLSAPTVLESFASSCALAGMS